MWFCLRRISAIKDLYELIRRYEIMNLLTSYKWTWLLYIVLFVLQNLSSALAFICLHSTLLCNFSKISTVRVLFCRHALNVQIFIKMNRSDFAEKQLRVMQQIDEDHTLTQLANAWFDLAVVLCFSCICYSVSCSCPRLLPNYQLLWNIRVGPRFRKLTSSSKTSPRSIRWQAWFWTAKPFAACTWETLMKPRRCYSKL